MRVLSVLQKFVVGASLLVAGMAAAQLTSGNLAGAVKDGTGAAVPNASLVLTNESTGVTTTLMSNGSGEFLFQNLQPATYDLKVTAAGFAPALLKGVRVDLNSTATANVPLSLGSQSTTVEVAADASALLDTTTTNLTTSFSNVELSDLPTTSVGLGVLNASLLSPGVASTGGIGIGVGPSVGGNRPRNNNFTIEGIDNNNKAVTGPLVYVPNDAVGSFTLITNQFSPEFGHSSGGQFNSTTLSGTNSFHGRVYEYFQNRNLNAAQGIAGGKVPNGRYDNNRYGGQFGGPIFRDKLFFFANYERNPIGQNLNYFLCSPTAAGLATLGSLAGSYGFSAVNLAQYLKYNPPANFLGGAQVNDVNDNGCFNNAGPQVLTVTDGGAKATDIPLGNYQVNTPTFSNFDALTSSVDYTITNKDSIRLRYIYNKLGSQDTAAALPVFFVTQPNKFHLFALSEFHSFSPNLVNELRLGFNRFENTLSAGNFAFPGVDSFPTFQFFDQGGITLGPDGNAPQFTIQNLYQLTDNVSYTKGSHTIKLGFDGRKYISPQGFTQRARGDYEYNTLDFYLRDLAPDAFGERSSGNHTFYGDQTALYGYANDTWRVSPTITLNLGLRYEFTSVPFGERSQALNAAASVPGLITFGTPKPTYTSIAPRVGINFAPDGKTSIRLGYGIAYDVLFDNFGTLSFPPQYSTTEDVGTGNFPAAGAPNFLKGGGLPPGTGSGVAQFCTSMTGPGTGVPCNPDIPAQRAATSAFVPDQVLPYTETYTLNIQRSFGTNYTAEIGYTGTRGIHLPTQIQLNIQPRVTPANELFTTSGGNVLQAAGSPTTNLPALLALSNIVPGYRAAGFRSKITSFQPFSQSNYNGLLANLTRRFQQGLQMNLSYTWSKTMDDATAEVFATVLTPRRQQNSQNISADYSRSALDRTHRVSLEALYDLPYYKHSNSFLLRNLVGNWEISPIYTYESPEYATVLSGDNANLNKDSAVAISRTIINPNGNKALGTGVRSVKDANGNIIGYDAIDPNAYYVQAGRGTLPTAGRNTLPIRPIDNVDLSAFKRFTVFDHYSLEFGAQAFNVLNHPQYIPGTVDNVNSTSFTASYNFQTVTSGAFNHPDKIFGNNARAMQLSGKISF